MSPEQVEGLRALVVLYGSIGLIAGLACAIAWGIETRHLPRVRHAHLRDVMRRALSKEE